MKWLLSILELTCRIYLVPWSKNRCCYNYYIQCAWLWIQASLRLSILFHIFTVSFKSPSIFDRIPGTILNFLRQKTHRISIHNKNKEQLQGEKPHKDASCILILHVLYFFKMKSRFRVLIGCDHWKTIYFIWKESFQIEYIKAKYLIIFQF